MKMKLLYLFLMISLCSCNTNTEKSSNNTSPVDHPVLLGDPFILLYGTTYYAYGTANDNGIPVLTSTDLKTWTLLPTLALEKKNSWGDRWFWAPEVYCVKGKFYMYYSADEHACVATSNAPTGPFVQEDLKPIISSEKCIDGSLFVDSDGKAYFYFVRFNDGNNIWVAEMNDDLISIKEETMKACIHVSQAWEEVWPRVNEGPFVVKHNNLYYMTYSANSFESPFYGVGCATSTSPLGPWTKYDNNPILQKPGKLQGVGHSAFFIDKEGRRRIVFHAHFNAHNIQPRVMYISDWSFTDDKPAIMQISTHYMYPQMDAK